MYQSPVAGAAIVTCSASPVVTGCASELASAWEPSRVAGTARRRRPPLVLTLSASAAAVRLELVVAQVPDRPQRGSPP